VFRRRLRRWHRTARRQWQILNATPRSVRLIAAGLLILAVFSAANLVYHVVRKPSEMFFPVSGALNKMPVETWHEYAPLFREYSTAAIPAELLAALAQVEGAGNPLAHTYWRWRWRLNLFAIYQPASSSVGMYQMTDPAFAEARRYCIRGHAVMESSAWNDWHSCWFTGLYTRLVPSHAVELTAIFLDRAVAAILARDHIRAATSQQKQDLAAIVHLCGAGTASAFARRGFQLPRGERCGDHEAAPYLARVDAMKRQFLRLAASP